LGCFRVFKVVLGTVDLARLAPNALASAVAATLVAQADAKDAALSLAADALSSAAVGAPESGAHATASTAPNSGAAGAEDHVDAAAVPAPFHHGTWRGGGPDSEYVPAALLPEPGGGSTPRRQRLPRASAAAAAGLLAHRPPPLVEVLAARVVSAVALL